MSTKYPKQWSNVTVYYRDGTSSTMNMSAGVLIGSHMMKEMKEYGFCSIRNEKECLIISADMVERILIQQLTTGETS